MSENIFAPEQVRLSHGETAVLVSEYAPLPHEEMLAVWGARPEQPSLYRTRGLETADLRRFVRAVELEIPVADAAWVVKASTLRRHRSLVHRLVRVHKAEFRVPPLRRYDIIGDQVHTLWDTQESYQGLLADLNPRIWPKPLRRWLQTREACPDSLGTTPIPPRADQVTERLQDAIDNAGIGEPLWSIVVDDLAGLALHAETRDRLIGALYTGDATVDRDALDRILGTTPGEVEDVRDRTALLLFAAAHQPDAESSGWLYAAAAVLAWLTHDYELAADSADRALRIDATNRLAKQVRLILKRQHLMTA
jgi:hypothetical protein